MVLAPSPRLLPTWKWTSRARRRIPVVHNVPHKLSCSWVQWAARRFRLEQRDRTVVVKKIPEDGISPDAVRGCFKRFGTVTDVVVDATGGKALVSFSTHKEAHARWKTEDAIMGNRFIKVFWPGGPRFLRGSALSTSRSFCADCHPLHSSHHSLRAYPRCSHAVRAPREEHRPRRRVPDHRLRGFLVSNCRHSPR